MDYLNNIGDSFKSFAGNIPKAMLVVRDPSTVEPSIYHKLKVAQERRQPDLGNFSAVNTTNALEKMQKGLLSQYRSNKGLAVRFDDAKDKVHSVNDNDIKFVVMEVQYNPSTLRLDTNSGYRDVVENGALANYHYPVATTLSVQLVFEDINVHDAFMLSNLAPSIGNAASAIKDNFIGGRGDDKSYSIQTHMDGLLALLTRIETRYVMFIWGGMYFYGEICNVSVKYKMFNKKGAPVLGTVDIQIYQQKPQNEGNESYWNKVYEAFFSDNDTSTGGFSKVNNNILGLNL